MSIKTLNKYFLGFQCVSTIKQDGLVWRELDAVSVAKGDILIDNGSGYATNASITAFAATFLGVAAADVDNSGGSAGDLNVPIIPPRREYVFWVPNESGTVAAQTDIGEVIDLESEDGVDVTDTTCTAYGFQVDDIDISANAVAAATGGFVRGRFITA